MLVMLYLGAAGCTTRVVDLALPPDAGSQRPPRITCDELKRADGTTCRVCLGDDGALVGGNCEPPRPPPAVDASPPGKCQAIPAKEPRCLTCGGATGEYTVCLSCEPPVASGQGDRCRVCAWDDLRSLRCLQCFATDGSVTHDDCNAVRQEVVAPGP